MLRVLFVCTGNVFRSMSAEYAVRRELLKKPRWNAGFVVSSAGTDELPHLVWHEVRDYLLMQGLDVSPHRRRTLTRAIFEGSDLVVAMSTDHREFIRRRFGQEVPLFTEACSEPAAPLPDVEEAVPDYRSNAAAVTAHLRMTIDRIIALAPRLAERLAGHLADGQ